MFEFVSRDHSLFQNCVKILIMTRHTTKGSLYLVGTPYTAKVRPCPWARLDDILCHDVMGCALLVPIPRSRTWLLPFIHLYFDSLLP